MKKRIICALAILAAIAVAIAGSTHKEDVIWFAKRIPFIKRFFRPTVALLVSQYGSNARARLVPLFEKKHLPYPPEKVSFLAIKNTKQLLVYCTGVDGKYQYVCKYPIFGASGHLGPKLRNGDMQVPEGLYQLTLEPDTPYHAALRLNYPNPTDLARAKADGRADPGSDILIHGTTGSIGCIAMGDQVSEDLFVLVNDTRDKNVPLIVAPVDLRSEEAPGAGADSPSWLGDLYREIKDAMGPYPLPSS